VCTIWASTLSKGYVVRSTPSRYVILPCAIHWLNRAAPGRLPHSPSLAADARPPDIATASRILSNFVDCAIPDLVGGDEEMRELEAFWADPHAGKFSIVGQGGVGKTAFLDAFTRSLLWRSSAPDTRPNPEVIIYLTAKDNYLDFMEEPPESMKFQTLRRIYEATLQTMGHELSVDEPLDQLRASVLSLTCTVPIFLRSTIWRR
jgi:hypothetical protein